MYNMIVKSIMLIDDDLDEHDLFLEALRELSDNIVLAQAFDGSDALAQLQACATLPDLIFLDINMPMQSGFDTLRLLKAMRACSRIPVVMYSTSAAEKDRKLSMALGAWEYVVKPISCVELSQLLHRYVKASGRIGG